MSHQQGNDLRLQRINQKGWEVAQKLQSLKAGQDVSFAQLGKLFADGPRETPEERLRRYLDQINRARTRLQDGTYGHCSGCGKALAIPQLDEMPWVEYCRACAALE
jgi:RNA polymerase-binding transcription factor DksA